MAYPTVSAPYGLKPISLIGGQVFAGSTRLLPIQYNYGINITYGDVVSLTRGFITRLPTTTGASVATGGAGAGNVGVFLGCTFTNPVTKQKTFSQYWPANTLAGDGQAYVTDDPDTLFKVASVTTQGGTVIGSFSSASVGLNVQGSDLAGNINTGNSNNAALGGAPAVTATFPLRVVDLVKDTAVVNTATLVSGGGSTTLTVSALSGAIPQGAEVGYIASNGQYIGTGTYVAASVAAGSTTVTLAAQAATVNAGGVASTNVTISNGAFLVFTQYPEALVKFNFGIHEYYNTLGSSAL